MECSRATLYIMSGFSSHWPSCAQATQCSSVSVQLNVQMPHESGHSATIESGFFSHSPSRALATGWGVGCVAHWNASHSP